MKTKNQKNLLLIALMLVVISGILFYYNEIKIPRIAEQAKESLRFEIDETSMPKGKIWIVSNPMGIAKYTEMTEEIIREYASLVEIPIKYIVDGAIGEMEMIKGYITKDNLRYGQQLLADHLYSDQDWYGEADRLKEFRVTSLVANEVKGGNIVDVLVHYGNGDYDVVVSKIKVRRIIEELGEEGLEKEAGYIIILAVNEAQYRDLTLASQLGNLETRLYLDIEQSPSPLTFNYQKAMELNGLTAGKEKLGIGNINDAEGTGINDNKIIYQRNEN